MTSNREIDANGFIHIKKNPISKVGVFPYLGKNIDAACEPNKIYWVYRPAEELCKPETIESFKNIPFIDDHTMIGKGATPAERKGVDGNTGGDVVQEGDFLYADLHIYSDTLKRKMDGGKKELSMGYRVGRYEKANGTFNGQPYDFIQRDLRGNHIALVQEGRMGKEVSVLDQGITYDHMDIVEDAKQDPEHPNSAASRNPKEYTESRQKANEQNRKNDAEKASETYGRKKPIRDTASDSTASPAADKEGDAECNMTKDNNMDKDKEEKEAKDKMAKDAAEKEEKEKKEAADKKAKDESEEEEKKKKAEDKKAMDKKAKDEDEMKDKEKKEGMDAAISGLRQEIADLKKNGVKALMGEITKRNEVAKTVESQFGTFDHAELTCAEVAAYGLKKAGIEAPTGSEIAVWDAYSKGLGARRSTVALDAKDKAAPVDSLIAKTLAASK